MSVTESGSSQTARRAEIVTRRHTKVAFAVLLAGVCCIALSACAPIGTTAPTTNASSAPTPATGIEPEIGATCSVLSVIATNLSNARDAHKASSLDDASYAAIVNEVQPGLQVIQGVSGYGLQTDLKKLSKALTDSPSSIAGASFDPNARAFDLELEQLALACQANSSPITIMSTSG